MLRSLLSLSIVFMSVAPVFAGKSIEAEKIKYSWDNQEFHGYLAKPKKMQDNTPAVLIVHEWWGHNDYAQKRAKMLAEEGYVALAIDMYGNGAQAKHPSDAGKMASAVSANLDVMKKRFDAGMRILSSQAKVDKNNMAAFGYCFGGGVVLQMARERMPLKAVVSFHGSLATKNKVQGNETMPKILVFNGGADPMVTEQHINDFRQEMIQAEASFEFVEYPGAKHAFTNPEATKLGKKFSLPLAYNKAADQASWQQSLKFLEKTFSEPKQKVVKAKVIDQNPVIEPEKTEPKKAQAEAKQ